MGKIIGLVFEKPSFVCPVCGKAYKTEDSLNKHIAKEHPAGQGTAGQNPAGQNPEK